MKNIFILTLTIVIITLLPMVFPAGPKRNDRKIPKLSIVLAVISMLGVLSLFLIRGFPPFGQACIDGIGTGCTFHEESAFEFFILKGGTFADLRYIREYEKHQKFLKEESEKSIRESQAKLPELTLEEMRKIRERAKTKPRYQGGVVGKYRGILVSVIEYSYDQPSQWQIFYSGTAMSVDDCKNLSGRPIFYSNGRLHGCSPLQDP